MKKMVKMMDFKCLIYQNPVDNNTITDFVGPPNNSTYIETETMFTA
jgi:hypothetical protein